MPFLRVESDWRATNHRKMRDKKHKNTQSQTQNRTETDIETRKHPLRRTGTERERGKNTYKHTESGTK
jgi:hypothetical protein